MSYRSNTCCTLIALYIVKEIHNNHNKRGEINDYDFAQAVASIALPILLLFSLLWLVILVRFFLLISSQITDMSDSCCLNSHYLPSS